MLSKKKQQVTKGSERYAVVQGNPKNTPKCSGCLSTHAPPLTDAQKFQSPGALRWCPPRSGCGSSASVRAAGFASEQPRSLWAPRWAPPRTGLRAQTAGHRQQFHVQPVIPGQHSTEAVLQLEQPVPACVRTGSGGGGRAPERVARVAAAEACALPGAAASPRQSQVLGGPSRMSPAILGQLPVPPAFLSCPPILIPGLLCTTCPIRPVNF